MSGKGRRGKFAATSVRASIASPNTCQYIDAGKNQEYRHGPFLLCSHQKLNTFYAVNIICLIFFLLPKCTVLLLETMIISSNSFKVSICDISIIVMINKDSLSFDRLFQLSAYAQRYRDIISASSVLSECQHQRWI